MARTLACLTMFLLAAGAYAQKVSPSVDPVHKFPVWYEDAGGTRVEPCLNSADPRCVLLADPGFNPGLPTVFPTNFPSEFFYFVADSDKVNTPGCGAGFPPSTATVRVALEGSFATGVVIPGNQITFARIRIVVKGGLCPNTQYSFTHPYGVEVVTTDSAGGVVANKKGFTQDIGCLGAPCNFSEALQSRVLNGFVRWDNSGQAAPAGYLGDAVTLHPVAVGPNMNNFFRIADASGLSEIGRTNLFTVSGKIAGPLVSAPASTIDFGGQNTGTTSAPKPITITNLAPAPVTISAASIAGPFAINSNNCLNVSLPRDASCTIGVTFTPTAVTVFAGALNLTHDGAFGSPFLINLAGTGTASGSAPTAVLSATTLAFGSVRALTSSVNQTVTLSNNGNAPLGATVSVINADTTVFPPSADQFFITRDTCSGLFVPAGASCSVTVEFDPTVALSANAILNFADNAAKSPHQVTLTGTGTGGLAAVSPTRNQYGFPDWYQDENGVQVEPCLNPNNPYCVLVADSGFNPALPLAFPTNFPVEFFYTIVDSDKLTLPGCPATGFTGGKLTYRAAVEGSFLNGKVVAGDQMTFARTKIVVGSGALCPNKTYAFTTPYGTDTYTTDSSGAVVANKRGGTVDIGCLAAPCNFSAALSSRIFGGFLKVAPPQPVSQPIGYLGDSPFVAFTHPVIGSPYLPQGGTGPANFLRVSDPATGALLTGCRDANNLPTACEVKLFSVSAKEALPVQTSQVSASGPLAFGQVPVGATSTSQKVTLTNISGADAVITSAAILATPGGVTSLDFTKITDNCSGQTLAKGTPYDPLAPQILPVAGGACQIEVALAPSTTGPLNAVLVVAHSGLNSPAEVPLLGVGLTAPPIMEAAPLALNFGTQAVGQASVPQSVTVTNTGGSTLLIGPISLSGSAADYSFTTSGCSGGLAPKAVCFVNVTFKPGSSATLNAQLSIGSNTTFGPQLVALTGIGGIPAITTPAPVIPDTLLNTTSAPVTVTVQNTGSAGLTIGAVTVNGDYQLASNGCAAVLAPGQTCAISVTFRPTALGQRVGTLTIPNNSAVNPLAIGLTGNGVAPGIGASPTTLVFADTVVGKTSPSSNVTVSNTGTSSLTIGSATATGDFAVAGNSCLAAPLAANASCTIAVTFTPAATGGRSGALSIVNNSPANPISVALSGKGVAPAITLSVPSLAFPDTLVNSTSAAQNVTVTNSGTADLVVGAVAATGDFAVSTNGCAATVAPGGSCAIAVTFTPLVAGARSGSLSITHNAAASPSTVALSGNGSAGGPIASVSPALLTFAATRVGVTSGSQTVILTNKGGSPLSVSSVAITGDFTIASNNCPASLGAGAGCSISITFRPTATGARAGSLNIANGSPTTPIAVPLSGTGTAPVISAAAPGFPDTLVNTASAAQNVVVKNTGTAPLNVSVVTFTGDFGLGTNGCAAPVDPGLTCSIGVVFTPKATGARSGSITIANDSLAGPLTIALAGNGVAPAVTAAPAALTFAATAVNATSLPQAVTVSNTGTAGFSPAVSASTGFTIVSNGCPDPVAPGTSCVINVAFKPLAAGTISGTLTVVTGKTVTLSGVAVAETLAISSATATVKTGGKGSTASWNISGTTTVSNANTITVTWKGNVIGSSKPSAKGVWTISANGSTFVPANGDAITATSSYRATVSSTVSAR